MTQTQLSCALSFRVLGIGSMPLSNVVPSSDPLGRYLIFSLLAASPQGKTLNEEESANRTETTTESIEDGLKGIEAILAIESTTESQIETTITTTGKPYVLCEKYERLSL